MPLTNAQNIDALMRPHRDINEQKTNVDGKTGPLIFIRIRHVKDLENKPTDSKQELPSALSVSLRVTSHRSQSSCTLTILSAPAIFPFQISGFSKTWQQNKSGCANTINTQGHRAQNSRRTPFGKPSRFTQMIVKTPDSRDASTKTKLLGRRE